MFCTRCGSQVKDGARFCPNCGTPMAQEDPQPYQQHEPYQPADAQQAPQQQAPQQQVPQPQSQPKAHRRWPIVVAACVVAAAAVAAVVVFVVLPRLAPKGVWVVTKSSYTQDGPDGRTTTIWTDTLDNEGNVIHESNENTYTNGSYNNRSELDYTYDKDGFCQSESNKTTYESSSSSSSSNNTSEDDYSYQWTFDANNKPTRLVRTQTQDGTTSTYTYDYEYSSTGHMSKRTVTFSSGTYKSKSVYEYASSGLLYKSTFSNDDESNETVYKYEFDSADKPTKCSSVTTDKSTGKKTAESTYNYEYDERGNIKSSNDEYISYSDGETSPQKSTATYEYEYTYVENPSPWVSEITHLYTIPSSNPY